MSEEQKNLLLLEMQSVTNQVVTRLDQHFSNPLDEEPLVVAVMGSWGSGKTTVLSSIQKHYQASDSNMHQVVPVWFTPWRYEKDEHLIVPLLQTIAETLQAVENKTDTMNKVAALAKLGARSILAILGGLNFSLKNQQA